MTNVPVSFIVDSGLLRVDSDRMWIYEFINLISDPIDASRFREQFYLEFNTPKHDDMKLWRREEADEIHELKRWCSEFYNERMFPPRAYGKIGYTVDGIREMLNTELQPDIRDKFIVAVLNGRDIRERFKQADRLYQIYSLAFSPIMDTQLLVHQLRTFFNHCPRSCEDLEEQASRAAIMIQQVRKL